MSLPIPTEDREQMTVVEYMRLKSIPHYHVPNSTYTKSWNQKRKNKELGVMPGVPDLFFYINGKSYAIEMKRQKGGTVSPFQKQWLKTLNDNGTEAIVAKGADEAIKFIQMKEGR